MLRQIIKIDEDKCNGCGICTSACLEGAIAIIDGKAKLIRDDYCDGLGNCLPVCPTGAISFEEREALPFDEEAVQEAMTTAEQDVTEKAKPNPAESEQPQSELAQWPVQIKLLPIKAPYYDNADLLIAADCTAYSYAGFHQKFMKDRITLIGCPKLDDGDYTEKLAEIIKQNVIRSVKVVRMEVPCCGGLDRAVRQALIHSGKMIPWQVVIISSDGMIISE